MSRTDVISPHEPLTPSSSDRELQYAEADTPNVSPSPLASNRKRRSVLFGAAISQLPIWGGSSLVPSDIDTVLTKIGFAMNYGVFQEYYTDNRTLQGNISSTGIIGTTSNGIMYLSMPFLFALFSKRWARYRQTAAICGAVLGSLSFLLSSFSTQVWHLVATQGVLAALGCAILYSTTTLSLGEWFNTSNRALAYGVTLSCKNIVGSACPFLFRLLLDRYGFRVALKIWAALLIGTSIISVFLIPTPPNTSLSTHRGRKIPWDFLKHSTFYIFTVAIIIQSSGYGLPQTYLNTYAHEVTLLSQTTATLMLTILNIPGILAGSFFGWLSDNKYFKLSAATITFISAMSSALSVFLLWGLTSQGSLALLILFSIAYGFFAGGYSATWGSIINQMEDEAKRKNEAIDTGMIYGLLNGARGIGYVSGGFAGVQLLKAGSAVSIGQFGYGTSYGPLIVFTGISSFFGGWGILWKLKGLRHMW
jgi:MFS family permease